MSVRNAILELLLERPIHGYRIRQQLDERFGEPVSSAQVYQSVRWLEARRLVESVTAPASGRPRRELRITERGRALVRGWLDAPIRVEKPQRDELLVKVCVLGRRDPAALARQLAAARRELDRALVRRARASGGRAGDRDVVRGLVDECLRLRASAEIAWIDHCLARLAESCETPPGAADA